MDIPDGVKIKINAKIIEVEGPRGKLSRNFKHLNLDNSSKTFVAEIYISQILS
jgi:ribosomal protein L6P/L9E